MKVTENLLPLRDINMREESFMNTTSHLDVTITTAKPVLTKKSLEKTS